MDFIYVDGWVYFNVQINMPNLLFFQIYLAWIIQIFINVKNLTNPECIHTYIRICFTHAQTATDVGTCTLVSYFNPTHAERSSVPPIHNLLLKL